MISIKIRMLVKVSVHPKYLLDISVTSVLGQITDSGFSSPTVPVNHNIRCQSNYFKCYSYFLENN